jgi:fluoride exporter
MTAIMLAFGGALGTLLRYGASVACASALGTQWPYGTFLVNLVGSFLLGIVSEVAVGKVALGVDMRLVLGTGVLGGFTTYSAFNLESLRMAQAGEGARVLGYVVTTVLCCMLAGMLGLWLGARMAR